MPAIVPVPCRRRLPRMKWNPTELTFLLVILVILICLFVITIILGRFLRGPLQRYPPVTRTALDEIQTHFNFLLTERGFALVGEFGPDPKMFGNSWAIIESKDFGWSLSLIAAIVPSISRHPAGIIGRVLGYTWCASFFLAGIS